jgi:hypothetical protein
MSSINVFVPVALAAERMIPSGTNSLQAETSTQ